MRCTCSSFWKHVLFAELNIRFSTNHTLPFTSINFISQVTGVLDCCTSIMNIFPRAFSSTPSVAKNKITSPEAIQSTRGSVRASNRPCPTQTNTNPILSSHIWDLHPFCRLDIAKAITYYVLGQVLRVCLVRALWDTSYTRQVSQLQALKIQRPCARQI